MAQYSFSRGYYFSVSIIFFNSIRVLNCYGTVGTVSVLFFFLSVAYICLLALHRFVRFFVFAFAFLHELGVLGLFFFYFWKLL